LFASLTPLNWGEDKDRFLSAIASDMDKILTYLSGWLRGVRKVNKGRI
jgi:hypothetical protein